MNPDLGQLKARAEAAAAAETAAASELESLELLLPTTTNYYQ